MKKITVFLKKIYEAFENPEVSVLPGQIAFFLVLSIIPMVTLIGYIASLFAVSLDSIISLANNVLPEQVNNILIPFISGQGIDVNVIIYAIMGFFVASNGPSSIILASNRLYGINDRNYIKRRIKAFFMTIILVVLFIFILIVLAFGSTILNSLRNIDSFTTIIDSFYLIFTLLKWPLAFIMIYLAIKLIYTMAPNSMIPSRYMNSGALFVTIGWTLSSAVYAYYVRNIANYSRFYGSLSNVIILMFWVYILAYIVVIGVVINVNEYKKSKIEGE